jgi:hypothetical protein
MRRDGTTANANARQGAQVLGWRTRAAAIRSRHKQNLSSDGFSPTKYEEWGGWKARSDGERCQEFCSSLLFVSPSLRPWSRERHAFSCSASGSSLRPLAARRLSRIRAYRRTPLVDGGKASTDTRPRLQHRLEGSLRRPVDGIDTKFAANLVSMCMYDQTCTCCRSICSCGGCTPARSSAEPRGLTAFANAAAEVRRPGSTAPAVRRPSR